MEILTRSEHLFESIIQENSHEGVTNYPLESVTKTGKVKKVPLVLKFIYENPGCTKQDIVNFTQAMGWTGLNIELFHDIVADGMVTKDVNNRKVVFYPTDRLIGYLKKIGFIDNPNVDGDKVYDEILNNKHAGKINELSAAYGPLWNALGKLNQTIDIRYRKTWQSMTNEEKKQAIMQTLNIMWK